MAYPTTKNLFEISTVPTTAAALYTVPGATALRVHKVTIANTGANVRTITAYVVPTAGIAGIDNALIPGYQVAPGSSVDLVPLMGHAYAAGTSLQVIVDAGTDCLIYATGTLSLAG
jgi:hypothetical protein